MWKICPTIFEKTIIIIIGNDFWLYDVGIWRSKNVCLLFLTFSFCAPLGLMC